jgi:hypothetical protein
MNAQDIELEHDRLGYRIGWRFITGKFANLSTATVAIIGLNPGGTVRHGPSWSQEEGNMYVSESWRNKPAGNAPLQQQVQRMMSVVGVVDPHEVFTAQFVPFRSPRWDDLPNRKAALAFSEALWSWALPQSPAKLFLCIGQKESAPRLANLLGAHHKRATPANWSACKIDRYESPGGHVILGLPHLSIYKLFSRPRSIEAFKTALSQ